MVKIQKSQFEIMVDFMERNSDIKWNGFPQDRVRTRRKWKQLVKRLNHKRSKEETKSINKWRKTWSDLKNHTKKKAQKSEQPGAEKIYINPLEKRILKIIGIKYAGEDESVENEDTTHKAEGDSESGRRASMSPQPCFTSVDCDQVSTCRSRSRSSMSCSSRDSSLDSVSSEARRKKKKEAEAAQECVKDITNKFLEVEKQKGKLAHEQEMARIQQNEKLLNIVDKMVNVLETLTPSIQRRLDRNSYGDG